MEEVVELGFFPVVTDGELISPTREMIEKRRKELST